MSQSVRRAARIIDELATHPQTVSHLAKKFGLHRSTMFRELKSLEEVGYARRRPDGTYCLGMKLLTLGQEVLAEIDVRAAAAEPARCSAVGKAILAGVRGPTRQNLLERATWEKHTHNTITDRSLFEAELERVATRGWAVPITSSAGVVGALAVTAIRMVNTLEGLEQHLPLMRRVAGQIGLELG